MNILKRLRKDQGLSQSAVAKHMGWSVPTVAFTEVGKRSASLSEIEKYAELFEVDPKWLTKKLADEHFVEVETEENTEDVEEKDTRQALRDLARKHARELFEKLTGRKPSKEAEKIVDELEGCDTEEPEECYVNSLDALNHVLEVQNKALKDTDNALDAIAITGQVTNKLLEILIKVLIRK